MHNLSHLPLPMLETWTQSFRIKYTFPCIHLYYLAETDRNKFKELKKKIKGDLLDHSTKAQKGRTRVFLGTQDWNKVKYSHCLDYTHSPSHPLHFYPFLILASVLTDVTLSAIFHTVGYLAALKSCLCRSWPTGNRKIFLSTFQLQQRALIVYAWFTDPLTG